jgi:YHS domain-containing protein
MSVTTPRRFAVTFAAALAALLALAAVAAAAPLEKAEAKYVCMVNNRVFDKEQIKVEVEGRTYYGCCEMCKKALAEKPELRVAVDPVSGHEVDKSKAVIGVLEDGSVVYFESEENFKKFQERQKQG